MYLDKIGQLHCTSKPLFISLHMQTYSESTRWNWKPADKTLELQQALNLLKDSRENFNFWNKSHITRKKILLL